MTSSSVTRHLRLLNIFIPSRRSNFLADDPGENLPELRLDFASNLNFADLEVLAFLWQR
jgi:hypothetical protein